MLLPPLAAITFPTTVCKYRSTSAYKACISAVFKYLYQSLKFIEVNKKKDSSRF